MRKIIEILKIEVLAQIDTFRMMARNEEVHLAEFTVNYNA
jgi:hypothetical protein